MRFDTSPAPHVIAGYTVPRVMFQVLLALVPAGIAHVALFGPGLLLQLSVACVTALLAEAGALRWRGRDAMPALRDGSVLVTAFLLAFSIPPLLPWWLGALGTALAVLLGKHVFGGLGQNPFNPAMVGYAILLVSFPAEMTRWPVPLDVGGTHTWSELARLSFESFYGADRAAHWDGYTGATALDSIRNGLELRYTLPELLGSRGHRRTVRRTRLRVDQSRGARGRPLPDGARDRALAYPGGRAGRPAGAVLRRARAGFRCRARAAAAGIFRCHDAGRVLHRDRSSVCRDQRSRSIVVRRWHRPDRVDHSHLGRLPRRLRLRGPVAEPGRAIHRPLHSAENLWPTQPDRPLGRTVRAAVVLAAAAIAAFGLVAVVHEATRDQIAATEHARELARFDQVLAGRPHDNDLLADTVTLRDPELLGTADAITAYRARLQGKPVAVVLEPVAPDGYSGAIRLLIAVAPDGTVLGVRAVAHRETPGLGDFIDTHRSDWIERFTGKSTRNPAVAGWRVRKDGGEFDQYTGATITSRAVVGTVSRTLEFFARHRDELLAAPATISP